jgi:MFS family permease
VIFTGITLMFYLVHMQSVVTLPVVIDRAGATPLTFGLILALDPLIVVAAQLLLQHRLTPDMTTPGRSDLNPTMVCAAGVSLVGIGLAMAGTGTNVAWFAATVPIWVTGEVLWFSVAQGIIAKLTPAHLSGAYFGIWGSCQGISALTAPLIASALLAHGGPVLLWTLTATVATATGIACLIFGQAYRARLQTI